MNKKVLLKNGLIVDGTGKNKGFIGNILINEGKIEQISQQNIASDCNVIDCTGKVISPGFVDMHSHNDWFLTNENAEKYITPFVAQGITTSITGNCGFGIAGFKKNTKYKNEIKENPFRAGDANLNWSTMQEYFDILSKKGLINNIACLAGHGTARASMRGYDPKPLSPQEKDEILHLLEEALDQGAKGVSFGLQYEPGIFATLDEIKDIAKLVKSKNKIMTVHAKAYSSLSGAYPIKLFGRPHNLIALKDMINIAKETGVKLQFSHLIYVGAKTFKTVDKTLEMIDKAISEGVDIKFDTYSYSCGASVIAVILPEWFMAKVPEAYDNKKDLAKLRKQLTMIERLLGFGFKDIQIAYANNPEYNKYNGMFVSEIAKEMNISNFDAYIEIAKHSNGKARVMQYKYSTHDIVKKLMKHSASMFMTDAWIENTGVQNPSCFASFPRFLQMARDENALPLEEVVYKMTGACAERASIKDRGILKEGLAADITIFDYNTVRDNTTETETDKSPTGIEHVFINGEHMIEHGKLISSEKPGVILK